MNIYLIIAVILLILGHVFKNLRWKQIIRVYEDVDTDKLLQIMAVGQGINMVLPFRIGDLVRIVMLGRYNLKNGCVLSLASVLVDIFIDTVTVGIAFISLYRLGIHQEEVGNMAVTYGILSLVSFTVCLICIVKKKLIKKIIYMVSAVFNETIQRKVLLATYTVLSSIKTLFGKYKIVTLISFTVGTWISYFLSYGAFALALQKMHYDFTLTRVFKTIFSMTGNSLFIECIKGKNNGAWGVRFLIYLLSPLCIIFIWTIIRQAIHQREGNLKLKYRKILPQLKPTERLAFLSIYFNSNGGDYLNSYLELNKDVSVLQDYSAGSNATTILCMNEKGVFFRKYAFGEDAEKLWKQMEWIKRYECTLPLTRIIGQGRRCVTDAVIDEPVGERGGVGILTTIWSLITMLKGFSDLFTPLQ